LLVGHGANDTTTNIKDSSSNNLATTINGNTVISTAISPPAVSNAGSGSVYFDGVGDYVSTPYSAVLQFTGDFTIEFWAYPLTQTSSFAGIVGNYATWPLSTAFGMFCGHAGVDVNKWVVALFGTFPALKSTSNWAINTWTHIAVVRSGTAAGNIKLYINGLAESSFSSNNTVSAAGNNWDIGRNGAGQEFKGYIYDFRLTKGVARYTANYTPPPFPPTSAMPTY
jgi:hypothetical protein